MRPILAMGLAVPMVAAVPAAPSGCSVIVQLTDALGGFDETTCGFDVTETCQGDVSVPGARADGVVDAIDLPALLAQWDTPGPADLTGPGGVPDGPGFARGMGTVLEASRSDRWPRVPTVYSVKTKYQFGNHVRESRSCPRKPAC